MRNWNLLQRSLFEDHLPNEPRLRGSVARPRYGAGSTADDGQERWMPSAGGPTSLELFAGGGGMALGLHNAGFRHAALIEYESKACLTLLKNADRWKALGHSSPPWLPDQVHETDVRQYLRSQEMVSLPDVDLVAGGPPCQPFSLGGVHAGVNDERNMFPAALDFVRVLMPKFVVFENVPGLLRPSFLPYFEYVEEQLRWPTSPPVSGEPWQDHLRRLLARRTGPKESRYWVTRQVINSAGLGVPQQRRRVFILAVRRDLRDGPLPENPVRPTHSEASLLYSQWVDHSYWEEHGIEPPPPNPARVTEDFIRQLKIAEPEGPRWTTVRDAVTGHVELAGISGALPEPTDHRESPGWLNHVGIPGARSYPGHTGSDVDYPAKTIKAGVHGVCGGEAMTRYQDGSLRYWTVRESARIQSFPDDYEFVGARSNAMRHIGNAVAVRVAEAVGTRLRQLAG